MGERITDKKLKNKRFKKTEEAIIMALFAAKETLSIDRIIRIAGISRSTLHRHHKTVYDIIPNYERYILRKYERSITCVLKIKKIRLACVYRKTLIFIRVYHRIIELLIKYGKPDIIEKIIAVIKPKILATGKITNTAMFAIYTKEVSEIIAQWVLNGFDKAEILNTVEKIMYLTNSAKDRLGPITR